MEYIEICKFVFKKEVIDWALCGSKKRDRELVDARQIAVFLGNWFLPHITWTALGAVFGRDHATAMHSVKAVKFLMYSDKKYRLKVYGYIDELNQQFKDQEFTDVERILKVKDDQTIKEIISLIDKMELIAKVYCSITNTKMTKNEN